MKRSGRKLFPSLDSLLQIEIVLTYLRDTGSVRTERVMIYLRDTGSVRTERVLIYLRDTGSVRTERVLIYLRDTGSVRTERVLIYLRDTGQVRTERVLIYLRDTGSVRTEISVCTVHTENLKSEGSRIITLCLLVSSTDNICKQFGPRSGLTLSRAWYGSKLFDSLMVFLKEYLKRRF